MWDDMEKICRFCHLKGNEGEEWNRMRKVGSWELKRDGKGSNGGRRWRVWGKR